MSIITGEEIDFVSIINENDKLLWEEYFEDREEAFKLILDDIAAF
jgi:hypothetical protein